MAGPHQLTLQNRGLFAPQVDRPLDSILVLRILILFSNIVEGRSLSLGLTRL